MKFTKKIICLWVFVIVVSSCVNVDDLFTPNVAAPVLVLIEGTEFEAASGVTVTGTFLELDKSGILDQQIGIDSIPVADLEIKVFINQTEEVGSLVTDASGKALFERAWSSLGVDSPSAGSQVRLEFAGSHKNIAFRKYHNVRVK